MSEQLRERPSANPARKYLEQLATELGSRDHTTDITSDKMGRTVLKVGHPSVPKILNVGIRCGVTDHGWRFIWEWGETLDLPIEDTDAIADRVTSVLGVTA